MTLFDIPGTELWGVFLIASFAISPLLFLAVIGFLLAPLAALLSTANALLTGRSPWKALLGGFLASAMLFLPWVCLFLRNLGWRHANGLFEFSLTIVLGAWGVFSVGILTMVGVLWVFAFFLSLVTGGIFAGAAGASIFAAPIGFVIILVNALLWWKLRRVLSIEDYSDWPQGNMVVPLVYLEPFMAAYFWSVATPLILFGVLVVTLQFTLGAV